MKAATKSNPTGAVSLLPEMFGNLRATKRQIRRASSFSPRNNPRRFKNTSFRPDTNYPMGGYVTYQLAGLAENYYYGIRRYPYSIAMNKNPLTFKDIDPNQADPHSGVPTNPIIGGSADEVHNVGEIWGVTLWEARAKLIGRYGAAGNQIMLRLVTDGMNLCPPNPNFIQARDAFFQAVLVSNYCASDWARLWEAFSKRGMGNGASAPDSSSTSPVFESFAGGPGSPCNECLNCPIQ